jgi:hypothetical protein
VRPTSPATVRPINQSVNAAGIAIDQLGWCTHQAKTVGVQTTIQIALIVVGARSAGKISPQASGSGPGVG